MILVAKVNITVTSIEINVNGDDSVVFTASTRESVDSSRRILNENEWTVVGEYNSLVPIDGTVSLPFQSVVFLGEGTSSEFLVTADADNRIMLLPENTVLENEDLQAIPNATDPDSGANLFSGTLNYDFSDVLDISASPSQSNSPSLAGPTPFPTSRPTQGR